MALGVLWLRAGVAEATIIRTSVQADAIFLDRAVPLDLTQSVTDATNASVSLDPSTANPAYDALLASTWGWGSLGAQTAQLDMDLSLQHFGNHLHTSISYGHYGEAQIEYVATADTTMVYSWDVTYGPDSTGGDMKWYMQQINLKIFDSRNNTILNTVVYPGFTSPETTYTGTSSFDLPAGETYTIIFFEYGSQTHVPRAHDWSQAGSISVQFNAVPAPSSLGLLLAVVALLAARLRACA